MQSKFKRVILIDDNEIDLKINAKLLSISKLFSEIIICKSADEALTYLTNEFEQEELIATFILLDIQMPEMSGFEFLIQYNNLPKSILENCLLAMLSSTLDFGDIKKAEANRHVTKLFKKPLCIDDIISIIS